MSDQSPTPDTSELRNKLAAQVIRYNDTNVEDIVDQLVSSFHQFAAPNALSVANCHFVATRDLPAEWIDPDSGKRLYNQTAVEQSNLDSRIDELENQLPLEWNAMNQKIISDRLVKLRKLRKERTA